MITGPKIPDHLPVHTREVLQHIDAMCAVRAMRDGTSKVDQARELLAHARGEVFHFATMYLQLLETSDAA